MSQAKALHAHWDCFGGATGSSILAACLNVDTEHVLARDVELRIRAGLSCSGLVSVTLQVSHSVVASMPSTLVNVAVEDGLTTTYNLEEVRAMFAASDSSYIPDHVREKAEAVFVELVTAESKAHGRSPMKDTKFTIPTIVHVVGTLLGLHILKVGTISCSPLPLGEGSTWSEHDGLLPVPSPTTLLLLVGMPTCPGPPGVVTGDLVTPTAAALLRVLTKASNDDGPTQRPACFKTQNIGIGADVDGEKIRVLRLLIGEVADTVHEIPMKNTAQNIAVAPLWTIDKLTHLEANLDDMTAEALAFAVQILLENGALDAWIAPIVMKKGRAAHTLHCLCRSNDSSDTMTNKLLQLVFRHTTTLGIRIHRNIERAALQRSFMSVRMPFSASESQGEVKVKIGYLGEEVVSVKAEFDDCAEISRQTNISIQQVADYAMRQAHTQLQGMKNRDSAK